MPSVMMLVPSARQSAVVICGCMSVGKPGYGSVLMLVLVSLPSRRTSTASSNSVTSTLISRSFAVMHSRWRGMTFFTRTEPPQAAAAAMKVPASIWSGMME